jgi:hypothetical protein
MTHRRGPHGGRGVHQGRGPLRRRRPASLGGRVARGAGYAAVAVAAASVVSALVVVGLAGLLFLGFFLVLRTPMLPMLFVGGVLLVGARRRRRRVLAAGTAPLPRRAAPAPAPPRPDRAWSAARERFHALRAAYAAHECDPMAVLRLPALSDVTVPSTARFVDAFAEAQALETDAFPPASHAEAFAHAVERAERAWSAARDAAERIRLSNLAPAERGAVERVIKLLTTARDSDNDAERLAAYARARTELARLDRAGVVHLPRAAQAELEVAGRGRLTA